MTPKLPDFPWDSLVPYSQRAAAHPDGIVDLSIGTPVDPTPAVVRDALAAASDAPGYPSTAGTARLREAIGAWLTNRHQVSGLAPQAVLPTIGSKELVALLPGLLGVGAGDTVVIPRLAYPTYEVGARLVGAQVVRADGLTELGPVAPKLVWINSPSNPTGAVLPPPHLAKVVAWARERGAIVASDECYIDLGWDESPVSILHPDVSGGDHHGLLALHSLSKRSNLAGYRAAFVAGDAELVAALLEIRRHAGLIVPFPVQQAMIAAYTDESHVAQQRARYGARRAALAEALTGAGFRIDGSAAGLYLWATRSQDCWQTVGELADLGILVAPGSFYGPTGEQHVRVGLTGTDERVAAACARLQAP